MKKTFKRITAMLMTAALAGSASMMAMSAFADYTVTFEKKSGSNDTAKHTYEAYQVFKGDMSGTGADAVLSNIDWGTGVKAADLLSALKTSTAFGASSPFAECTDAASVAKVIDGWADNDANIQKFADLVGANLSTATVTGTEGNNTLTLNDAGYYFIKDKDGSLADSKLGAYTDYILKVVDSVKINPKEDVPTIEKNILESEAKKKANTASIGDVITFQLDSVVPDMSAYNKYYYVINDTMCEGLTFDNTSVEVFIDGSKINDSNYEVQTGDAAKVGTVQYSFQIVMKNFKSNYSDKAGKDIMVRYKATLNDNADRTSLGNENTVNLTYSNNPNHEYVGENEPSNTPGDGDVTGITPNSNTKTYTTSLLINKIDGADKSVLKGAKFELKGAGVNNVIMANANSFEEDANGTYYKLTDGTFTLTEPTNETASKYESISQKYKLNTTSTKHSGTGEESYVEAITDEKGIITFAGLGEGTYTLTEKEAPTGYNKLANPITITITANPTLTDPGWTVKKGDQQLTKPKGIYEFTVENNKGATLPGTGGIGTALFYTAGTLLIAGGATLLITKKRMNVKEK